MSNNVEKFRTPKSMQHQEIEEGLADYDEQKVDEQVEKIRQDTEVALEMDKKADEAIDSFYAEGLERVTKNLDNPLSESLKKYPENFRNEIFRRWLARDASQALWQMDEFEHLPARFQKDIAKYLADHKNSEEWVYRNILSVFEKITDRDLHKILIEKWKSNFSILAKNKEKLPYISDEEILEYANHNSGGWSGWYKDWVVIIPYIDKFPSVDRVEAIEGALRQRENSNPRVLIEHREKLGLSLRELINLFYEHKKAYELCKTLKHIDVQYHQEIAEKAIEQGDSYAVLQNAQHFQQIDVPAIIRKIAVTTTEKKSAEKGGLDIIKSNLGTMASAWGKQMPQELVDELVEQNPETMAPVVDQFGDKIDKTELTNKLFKKKAFNTVIDCGEKLSLKLDGTLAIKVIDEGGAKAIAETIDKFEKLPRSIYVRLVAEYPGMAYPLVLKFKGITKKDIYTAIENLPSNHRVVYEIINTQEVQVLLDDDLPGVLLKGNHGDILVQNHDKPLFKPFFRKIAEKIGEENYEEHKDKILELLTNNEPLALEKADFQAIADGKLSSLTFSDLNTLSATKRIDEFSLAEEVGAQEVYLSLKQRGRDWQSIEINKRFEAGAAVFGYDRMLAFAKAGHRHDALFGFDKILELQRISGLNPNLFFHNILQQVAMDTGTYGEENDTSYQKLNSVAQGFRSDIESVLKEARGIEGVPQLEKLLAGLKPPQQVFQSWKMLMQYKELSTLLERRELLEELAQEKNPRLKDYVSTLLFHPSVTNTHAVKLFWKNPYDFFELESSHTPSELHDLKKPSNYVHIPNLDLSPAELRDALVGGSLDKIQVWQPLEATYEVPSNQKEWGQYQEFSQKSLSMIFQDALGSDSKGIKNKKKLFGDIRTLIEVQLDPEQFPQTRKVATDVVQKFVNGKEVSEVQLSDVVQEEIRKAIYFGKFGYSKRIKTTGYKVKINLKSDPDGVVAGNDTQCCMPFGDGKNTLYTYNPICALMTVQKETGRGGYRTISQSVLTKDKDVKTPIADIRGRFEEIESGKVSMADLLPQDILRKESSFVACDSVEVANNYQASEYSQLLVGLYGDFLREYIERYGKAQHLDAKKAVLGSCTYNLAGTQQETNTYLPESPVAYSDKYGESVHVLTLDEKVEPFFVRRDTMVASVEKIERTRIQNPQIEYLSFQDTLETAYIEGKAYSGTTLKQGVAEMENALIAKDINNTVKGRANMSLKYVSKEGQMQAYLVAYEGAYGYNYKESKTETESCVYVMDIAKLPEAEKGVGMELINEFIRLYQKNYIKKDKLIPIKAEAREVSSYKLIVRHLDTWGRAIGIRFELEEGKSYQKGKDTMHPITIRPIRIRD